MYAVAMKNIYIAVGFGIITASQLALGVYMMTLAGKEGGKSPLLNQESLVFRVSV